MRMGWGKAPQAGEWLNKKGDFQYRPSGKEKKIKNALGNFMLKLVSAVQLRNKIKMPKIKYLIEFQPEDQKKGGAGRNR